MTRPTGEVVGGGIRGKGVTPQGHPIAVLSKRELTIFLFNILTSDF